jgi:hypothetical protein
MSAFLNAIEAALTAAGLVLRESQEAAADLVDGHVQKPSDDVALGPLQRAVGEGHRQAFRPRGHLEDISVLVVPTPLVDSAVSKTTNVPASCEFSDFAGVYMRPGKPA